MLILQDKLKLYVIGDFPIGMGKWDLDFNIRFVSDGYEDGV